MCIEYIRRTDTSTAVGKNREAAGWEGGMEEELETNLTHNAPNSLSFRRKAEDDDQLTSNTKHAKAEGKSTSDAIVLTTTSNILGVGHEN